MKKPAIKWIVGIASLFILTAAGNKYFEVSKNLEIYANVYKHLNTYYVDELNPQEIVETSINAVLETLDPYSDYIPSEELESFRFQNTGKYGGIGATIQGRGEYVMVVAPYKGSPADKAGIKSGDKFTTIDGQNVLGLSSDEVVGKLKGTPGTVVKMVVDRDGEMMAKELIREVIHVKNVNFYGLLENNIGYINLAGFTEGAGDEVRNAVANLHNQAKLNGIVLDLKGNGGGLLNEAINVASVFIPKGELVVSTKGKLKKANKDYHSTNDPEDLTTPLVVITDGSTASASEIVAGTIQDLDRGVIVGRQSFGKGLVQSTRPVAYNSQLKLTTAKYYIPSGRSIQRLNYHVKNANGEPLPIPDSLKKNFKTKKGRLVKDGGGIIPDIAVEIEEYSEIAFVLFAKNLLFDYALEYADKHPTIAGEREFELSDTEYNDFITFLANKDYSYKTATEKKLEELKEAVESNAYESILDNKIVALEDEVVQTKKNDIHIHKNQIKFLLEREIANQYYYRSGRIANGLDNDEDLKEVIDLFSEAGKYSSLLLL